MKSISLISKLDFLLWKLMLPFLLPERRHPVHGHVVRCMLRALSLSAAATMAFVKLNPISAAVHVMLWKEREMSESEIFPSSAGDYIAHQSSPVQSSPACVL